MFADAGRMTKDWNRGNSVRTATMKLIIGVNTFADHKQIDQWLTALITELHQSSLQERLQDHFMRPSVEPCCTSPLLLRGFVTALRSPTRDGGSMAH